MSKIYTPVKLPEGCCYPVDFKKGYEDPNHTHGSSCSVYELRADGPRFVVCNMGTDLKDIQRLGEFLGRAIREGRYISLAEKVTRLFQRDVHRDFFFNYDAPFQTRFGHSTNFVADPHRIVPLNKQEREIFERSVAHAVARKFVARSGEVLPWSEWKSTRIAESRADFGAALRKYGRTEEEQRRVLAKVGRAARQA